MFERPLLVACAAALLGLAGCATEPPAAPAPPALFVDSAFAPPSHVIDPQAALALSPAMRKFADTEMASEVRLKGPREGLIDSLYSRSRLQLDYDATRTRNASEAFEARSGNCLSLVLMTAAFAKYYHMPVRFNSVYLEETWTRSAGMFFVSGHVNISLSRPLATAGRTIFGDPELLTIDFLPPEQTRGQRTRVIDEHTVLAMYLNNLAAEALTINHIDEAYWYSRASIATDPKWLAAYNTLAVLYRRKGLVQSAENALRHVLAREPLNLQALSNLVLVLSDAGRQAEARGYAEQLALVQPVPPYKFFDQGVTAMRAGDFASARQLFRKELSRAAYVPEFHFWLALANYGLGDVVAAKGEIAEALENSTTGRDKQIYAAKLAWLNTQKQR